jgi:hypothetical protein
MVTFQIVIDVKDDRRVVLTLPSDVPIGPAELVVTVDSHNGDREAARAATLDRFLALAQGSSFRSTGPYPTRDEVHERD